MGDGKLSLPNDGYAYIEIPDEFLITDHIDPIHAIVESAYPNLAHAYANPDFLQSRTILTTNLVNMSCTVEDTPLDTIIPELLIMLLSTLLLEHI